MKKIYAIVLSLISSYGIYGQESTTPEASPCTMHYLGSLHAGSSGLGLNFKLNFKEHSSVRLGLSMIPFKYSTVVDLGMSLNAETEANYTNFHLLYEYQPIKSVKGIRLVGGLAYFSSANVTAKLTPESAVSTSLVTLTKEEIGDLDIRIDSKGIAPYIGIGLGKTLPKNRFNVNFDLGSYFLSSPTVTSVGTKLLANNESIGTTLTENLKDYRWLPVLQINFNYLIK